LKDTFNKLSEKGYIFISDRDKGLAATVYIVFLQGCTVYCCQYIADNIQTNFGAKYQPLFWRYTWAKDKESFKVYLNIIYYNYKL
jgi:hypothetical protein